MIDELDRELRRLRVPARRRRRIRLELEDHLACDPATDLGDPAALARQFADELGTAYARRAGFAVFIALAPVGILFGVLFLAGEGAANGATILGTQLAFVGGTLGLLRAWRLRHERVIASAESRVIARRAALGIAGGAFTLVGVGRSAPTTLGWVTIGVGCATLAVAGTMLRATRLKPLATGLSRDLSFDLGIDADPWRLAFAIAGAVALCIAVAGVAQADPFDGLARAVADGALCLIGFAVLGRPLGLRKSTLS